MATTSVTLSYGPEHAGMSVRLYASEATGIQASLGLLFINPEKLALLSDGLVLVKQTKLDLTGRVTFEWTESESDAIFQAMVERAEGWMLSNPLAQVSDAIEPLFTSGFHLAYEARDGALEPGGAQAIDTEAVDKWVNKGAYGSPAGDVPATTAGNRAVYAAAKIAGQDTVAGDGAVSLQNNSLGVQLNRTDFSFLTAVRFEASSSGTGIMWTRHSHANGASFIQYNWATNELFFRNLQQSPFTSNDITLIVPEDTDMCIGVILNSGTIKCFWYNADAELQEMQSTSHLQEYRANDIFQMMPTQPEFFVSKSIWWNSIDITETLQNNVAAMFVEGFPT